MKNKQYIYRWLFLPLVACIMAGTTGCGSDMTEESGKPSPDGGTYLTVTARGITDQPPTGGNYDDYIASLRILAFDENGGKLCNTLYKGSEGNGAKQWTATDDAITIKEKIGNGGGKYSFYFIANEEGYQTNDNNQTLSAVLSNIDNMDALKAINIMYSRGSGQIPGATAILMSRTLEDVAVWPGKENAINVELLRAFAKFELVVKDETNPSTIQTINNVTIPSGTLPMYYTLFEGQSLNTEVRFDNDIAISNATSSSSDELFRGATVYLPEMRVNEADDKKLVVNFTASNGSETRNYTVSAGGKNDTEGTSENDGINDYSLYRNYSYTTTARFTRKWGNPIQLSVTVNDWTEAADDNRTWAGASFSSDLNPNNVNDNNKNNEGYLYVFYEALPENEFDRGNDIIFQISIKEPTGMKWRPVLSNPAYFDVYVNEVRYEQQDLVIGADSENVEIRVRATQNAPSDEKPETLLSFTVNRDDTGATETLIVREAALNGEGYKDGFAGGNGQSLHIVLEPSEIQTN